MIKIVKSEWHQVESRFTIELTKELLQEIYPDHKVKEINALMKNLKSGEVSISEVIDDAYDAGVDIEWDADYDDWWTVRKGGFDITYSLEK